MESIFNEKIFEWIADTPNIILLIHPFTPMRQMEDYRVNLKVQLSRYIGFRKKATIVSYTEKSEQNAIYYLLKTKFKF